MLMNTGSIIRYESCEPARAAAVAAMKRKPRRPVNLVRGAVSQSYASCPVKEKGIAEVGEGDLAQLGQHHLGGQSGMLGAGSAGLFNRFQNDFLEP